MDTKVIEWKNAGDEDIVWCNPNDTIRWGASLIVKEWECAIFMRDGKLFDLFGPGRHILSTQNLPLLTRAYQFIMGYHDSPFKATVIFVSKKMLNGKWGIRAMIRATEEMAAPIPLMSHGNYQFRIEDPVLFITQVSGGNTNFTTSSVNNFIKGFITEKMIQEVSKYNYLEIYSNLEKASTRTQVNLNDLMRQRGVELIALKIINVDTEEEYRKDLYTYTRFKSSEGKNYRVFETMDKFAESLGKSGDANIGAGMLVVPQIVGDLMKTQTSSTCPHCHSSISAGSVFCSQCGKSIQMITTPVSPHITTVNNTNSNPFSICPFCGVELRFAKTPRFCPYCKENIELV